MSLVQEIEKAIELLPRPDRLKVCRDLPDLIGRKPENLIGSGPLRSLINWRQAEKPMQRALSGWPTLGCVSS